MNQMVQGLFFVAVFLILAYMQQLVKGQPQPHPDCQKQCGDIQIEYPFGISQGCYYPGDKGFELTCNETEKKLLAGNIEVISTSHNGELRVLKFRSYSCYDNTEEIGRSDYITELPTFTLSDKNMFTAVGCNTYVFMTAINDQRNYSTGCLSLCDSRPPENGQCSGDGCCRTSVPKKSNYFEISSARFGNRTSINEFNPCSYAFIVEDGKFNFSASEDLWNLREVEKFPIVLDWSIENQTCQQVGNRSICGSNSECFNSTKRDGYICTCKKGFDGNPYLLDGCQDINECTTNRHNCFDASTCINLNGGFNCKCPSGYRLDSTMSCKRKNFGWTIIVLGTIIGFLVLVLIGGFIKQRMKDRKDTKLREQYFEQNGGNMLIRRLSGARPSNVDVQIFTEKGMKEATKGYNESRILGQGGQGTVYKGILSDNSIVAIKRARLGDNSQVEQFINEVLVLSQINHRNVVKLLGCCLETEVPLLVYEFITNGTLFDHLHGSMFDSSLTWEHRLRIAIEIAGTLAYLHSSASIPIIHLDIKTANILLDENITAKVADFGASRLIPMDKEELATIVQGTLGYLDPEYYNTGLLNEKSDVYSFGVVLMELLSGQKALCFERPLESKHLVSYFTSATKENRLHEVIDGQVMMNEDNHNQIKKAARIAVECTRVSGEERPRMKEVAAELETLRVTRTKHQWTGQYPEPEEINQLLGVEILSAQGETSSTGYDSIKNVAILDIESGR